MQDSADAVLLGNILAINTMDGSHARKAIASFIDHNPIASAAAQRSKTELAAATHVARASSDRRSGP